MVRFIIVIEIVKVRKKEYKTKQITKIYESKKI